MQEKLVPFNLEEAKKNPERVRWSWGGKPIRIFFNDPTAAVNVADAEGARHGYDYPHFYRLRLVAVPKTKLYRVFGMHDGKPGIERAEVCAGWCPAPNVRDVSFDKATGIITVTYDE